MVAFCTSSPSSPFLLSPVSCLESERREVSYKLWSFHTNDGSRYWLLHSAPPCLSEGKRCRRARGRRDPFVVSAVADGRVMERLPTVVASEPSLVLESVRAFAPATLANLGPGFDILGCAIEGLGDHVLAEVRGDIPGGEVEIGDIVGDGGKLSRFANENCVGIAAKATLQMLGVKSCGVRLSLDKGLPLGSGMGSSAASAAAAAVAVNALFGNVLTKEQLVLAGLQSEATVSGYHADNVGPSLLGGFLLIRSYDPLELIPLPYPEDGQPLYFVTTSPQFEAPTRAMRAVLPTEVSMKAHIGNSSQAAALVAAVLTGNVKLLGSALGSDQIVEPRRGPLIPGLAAVKVAARAAGAYGCTISGAGPTAVAVTDSKEKGEVIGAAMVDAFKEQGKLQARATVQGLDRIGARIIA